MIAITESQIAEELQKGVVDYLYDYQGVRYAIIKGQLMQIITDALAAKIESDKNGG